MYSPKTPRIQFASGSVSALIKVLLKDSCYESLLSRTLSRRVRRGWQIVSAEISNAELQGDMRDIAAQVGSRIGLESPNTDEQLRTAVLHKAEEHGISLTPEQVTVRQTGEGKSVVFFLSADYRSRINLLVYSFTLHFTPSSNR